MALSASIGFYMKNINELLVNKSNTHLKEHNLTFSQIMIIMYCIQHDGEYVLQKELESFFDLTHSTVIGILKRLSQNGFVTVQVSDEDKRQRKVFLTKKTNLLAEEIEEHCKQFEKIIVQRLSEQEIETVQKYLQIIYENIKSSDFIF